MRTSYCDARTCRTQADLSISGLAHRNGIISRQTGVGWPTRRTTLGESEIYGGRTRPERRSLAGFSG
jgi:hypothetical protein